MSIVLTCSVLQRYGLMAGSGLFRFSTVAIALRPGTQSPEYRFAQAVGSLIGIYESREDEQGRARSQNSQMSVPAVRSARHFDRTPRLRVLNE
jgi:hypothetical protein